MKLLRHAPYRNSVIQVYECAPSAEGRTAIYLDGIDVTGYVLIDGGPADCIRRVREIIDHYSRRLPRLED